MYHLVHILPLSPGASPSSNRILILKIPFNMHKIPWANRLVLIPFPNVQPTLPSFLRRHSQVFISFVHFAMLDFWTILPIYPLSCGSHDIALKVTSSSVCTITQLFAAISNTKANSRSFLLKVGKSLEVMRVLFYFCFDANKKKCMARIKIKKFDKLRGLVSDLLFLAQQLK